MQILQRLQSEQITTNQKVEYQSSKRKDRSTVAQLKTALQRHAESPNFEEK